MANQVRFGIDVSDWQPGIDWPAVAGDLRSRGGGLDPFAMYKATEGTGNVQDTFAPNRDAVAGGGFCLGGAYHFARPEQGDPIDEARHFCEVVGQLGQIEVPILDIETGVVLGFAAQLSGQGLIAPANPTELIARWRAHVTAVRYGLATDREMERLHEAVMGASTDWPAFIGAWCPFVTDALGRRPVTYMSESPARSMPASVAEWRLWVAGYVSYVPTRWEDWTVGVWSTPDIWQFTSSGQVDGFAGRVDLNVAPADLLARLGLDTPLPAPTPTPPRRARFTMEEPMRIVATESNPATSSWRYDLTMCRQNGASAGSGAKLETAIYVTRRNRTDDRKTEFNIFGPNAVVPLDVSGGQTTTFVPTSDGAYAVSPVLEDEEDRLVVEYSELLVPA